MTTYADFYGLGYETSSGPVVIVDVHESDIWPIADNAEAAKDAIGLGLHPIIAIGGRIAADGRPMNVTGVVISYLPGLTVATARLAINIATGYIVKNYVSNIDGYNAGVAANSWEDAPVIGQPSYVDDSSDLGAGCTLSMSPLNDANPALPNPMAGVLWYDQDEYVNAAQAGGVLEATWPKAWSNVATGEHLVCILQINGARDLA